jgi:hypothetical protein
MWDYSPGGQQRLVLAARQLMLSNSPRPFGFKIGGACLPSQFV